MSQKYNRSYVYRDNVNNAVYFNDFIGIGAGSAGFQGYPSGPTGITGSYIFHDNTTSFVNSGSGETGFNFIYVSGETGPINIGTIGLSGFYDCRNLVPATSLTYDLGNSEKRWRSMYVGPGTIDFLGNSEASATIGVNPLGFVYTPTGFTTPIANLGAKSPGSSSNYSGGWAFTSDNNNNSIIYELTELGQGITGTQTFLNYGNISIDNYSENITIPIEVASFNLNGTSANVNIEIPNIRNQPLVLTNSCDTNATIIHNGTMYYNNVQQSGNVNISNNSVIIHWVPNWENNTSEIFIFDQCSEIGPTGFSGDSFLNFVFSGDTNTFVINSSTSISSSISAINNYGVVESIEAFNIVTSCAYFQFQIPTLPNGCYGPLIGTQNYNITLENQGTPTFTTKNGISPENTYPYADGDMISIFFDGMSVSLYQNGIFLMSSVYSDLTPQRFYWYNTGVFEPFTINNIKGYQTVFPFGNQGPTGDTGLTGDTGPNPYSYLGYTTSRAKYNKIGTSNNYIIELPSSSNVFLLVGDENAPNGLDGTPTSNTTIYGMTGGTNGRVVTLLFNADTTHNIIFHNQQTGIQEMFYLSNNTNFTLSKQCSITFMYSTDFFQYNNSSDGYWFMISHT